MAFAKFSNMSVLSCDLSSEHFCCVIWVNTSYSDTKTFVPGEWHKCDKSELSSESWLHLLFVVRLRTSLLRINTTFFSQRLLEAVLMRSNYKQGFWRDMHDAFVGTKCLRASYQFVHMQLRASQ